MDLNHRRPKSRDLQSPHLTALPSAHMVSRSRFELEIDDLEGHCIIRYANGTFIKIEDRISTYISVLAGRCITPFQF